MPPTKAEHDAKVAETGHSYTQGLPKKRKQPGALSDPTRLTTTAIHEALKGKT